MPALIPTPLMSEWSHDVDRIVDQPMGACLLVRSDVFHRLKGFDERFFVYFEEVDFCLRCKQLGHRAFFLRNAIAEHTGCGCSAPVPGKRLFYFLRSRILYGFKHFSKSSAAFLCVVTLFAEPATRMALAVARRSIRELQSVWEGYRLLWSSIPSLVRPRRENVAIGPAYQIE